MNRFFKKIWNAIGRFLQTQKDYWNHLVLLFKREQYPTWLSQDFKSRYRMLTRLKIIDEERKKQIDHHLVMSCSRRLAKLSFDQARAHETVTIVYRTTILLFILFVGKVYQVAGINLHTLRSNDYPSAFFGYFHQFGFVIAFLLLYSLFIHFFVWKISFGRLSAFYIIVLVLSILYISLPFTSYKIYAFGLVGFHIIILAAMGSNGVIRRGYDRYIDNQHPETIIIFNVLFVMQKLDEGNLKSYYSKSMLVTRLEYVALYIEKYLYKLLKTSDEEANEWMMERTRLIASGIRDKKKWIYTPKPDTAKQLADKLADFLILFLRNEWDALERVETPKPSQKRNWIRQASTATQGLVFGLLPISILLLLQNTNIVTVHISDSIITIAVIWAIVSILWLDPLAKDKIGALKDAKDIIPSELT
jgi:hypothetical protein